MSTSFELDPVSRITAGAIGEPGNRTFYIQARKDEVLVTLLAEKQQVQVLATTLSQLLETLDPIEDEGLPPTSDEMDLEDPLLPEWRIGPMAIEVEEDTGLMVFVAEEAGSGDEDDETAQDLAHARFVATRAQMKALAEHAEIVCSGGRPQCQFCGFPIDPG
ncbi:MAG TPA: DUF3090 family protein, partial [Actinomycetota bacterium]|nr:DUF3090 family protein [Actinomycetota bacterium]